MNLRAKILFWLMPALLPMALIIYLNYSEQRDVIGKKLLQISYREIGEEVRKLNDYLLLKDAMHRLMIDALRNSAIDPRAITPEAESALGRLMKVNPGFAMILFTDENGRILFNKVGLSRGDIPFLPRDITGKIAIDNARKDHLSSLYHHWKIAAHEYKDQIIATRNRLDILAATGEKNSSRYRRLLNKLLALEEGVKRPPYIVFAGGEALITSAGLPFRSDTYIFAAPMETSDGALMGFMLGILDWTLVENKIYSLKSELKAVGVTGADLALYNRSTSEFLIKSNNLSINDLGKILERKTTQGPSDHFEFYSKPMRAYLSFNAVVDTGRLTRMNDARRLLSGDEGLDDFSPGGANGSDFFLVACLPEADIFSHADRLLWRSILFTLLSISLLCVMIVLLSKKIVDPIQEMAEMAKRISEGDLQYRIKKIRSDEIGELAVSFNEMSQKLQGKQTELEVKNRELKSSEKRYHTLFNHVPFSICLISEKGWILDANSTMLDVLGYTMNELRTMRSDDVCLVDSERRRYKKILERDGFVHDFEANFRRKDGSSFVGRVTGVVLTMEDNPMALSIIEDISDELAAAREKKTVEKKLNRANKMKAIGLMAGGVAHDLNNILSGIVSYPDLILLDMADDSPLKGPIQTIQDSGKRAASVVSDLLTVARGVASVKELSNLNTLTSEYLGSPELKQLRLRQPGVEVATAFSTDLFNVLCSPVHIEKCLLNLVLNAAEAIPETGVVAISTANKYIDKPLKGYDDVHRGEYVVLSISDNGPGIDPNDLEHIFEPFYTKKVMGRSGTGLGLAVVWNTIQDHDGYIDVVTGGDGTRFDLYFPAQRARVEVEREDAFDIDRKGADETILVIDDERTQRDIACGILRRLGYRPHAVGSGEEAEAYMKEHSADLLLLDMIMDPGINGRETYERILADHPGQKAVIASGFSETDEVKKTQHLGAGAFIRKPYSLKQLGRAIRKELAT